MHPLYERRIANTGKMRLQQAKEIRGRMWQTFRSILSDVYTADTDAPSPDISAAFSRQFQCLLLQYHYVMFYTDVHHCWVTWPATKLRALQTLLWTWHVGKTQPHMAGEGHAGVPRSYHSTTVLKKNGLDASELRNYRPVSNLSVLSKLLEKVVEVCLQASFNSNWLMLTMKSAYQRFRSIETTVMKVNWSDLLLTADAGQMSAFCLLDLTTAFNIIDPKLLLTPPRVTAIAE